jgi:hypothetical protein
MFFLEKQQFRNSEQGRDTKFVQEILLVRHYIISWIVTYEEDSKKLYYFIIFLHMWIRS